MKYLNDTLAFSLDPTEIPEGFLPLTHLPVIIIVGLTGVGKSTVIELLGQEVAFTLLPNRRALTDEIIIASLQREAGEPVRPVADRIKRFEYTARYREKNPGGMAQALGQVVVKMAQENKLFIFDGLRGLNEVQHGSNYFPQSRFIVLKTPDLVRLNRLLNRGDQFDVVEGRSEAVGQNLMSALQAIPEIEAVFTPQQLSQIAQIAADYTPAEILKKVAIIVEERRNYDPEVSRDYLVRTLAPRRVLTIETTTTPPAGVVERIRGWL
jgi:AAA domain